MPASETRATVEQAARRTIGRSELRKAHTQFAEVSPSVGALDESALREVGRRDRDAAIALLADMAVATDPALRAQARALARRLLPALGAVGPARRRGTRRMAWHHGTLDGDLDLDRTLERSAGRRPSHSAEIVVRRFAAAPRAVCLLVDRSGSMTGQAVAYAALAASAVLEAAGPRLQCGVIAFSGEAMVLRDPRHATPSDRVVDDLLALRGHGRTDIGAALIAAADLLEHVPPGGRTAILLSDGLHTKGVDPNATAARLDCLHVLGPSVAGDAVAAGRSLARAGNGLWLPATTAASLARNLQRILS